MLTAELREHKEEIISLYTEDKLSTIQIGKLFDAHCATIKTLLKQWGIQMREQRKPHKYNINENFFENIDTPEKAYVLGFFYADGCNETHQRAFNFSLVETDKQILEDIKKVMETNIELQKIKGRKTKEGYQGKNQVKLRVSSAKMSKDLTKHGAPPHKTDKIIFPDWLPDNLMSHFIRGYFDGDGCIYGNSLYRNYACYLISNEKFSIGLYNYLLKIGLEPTITKESDKTVFRVNFYAKQRIKNFLDYIYKDATIYLKRKYNKYYSFFYEYKDILPYSWENNIKEINLKDD